MTQVISKYLHYIQENDRYVEESILKVVEQLWDPSMQPGEVFMPPPEQVPLPVEPQIIPPYELPPEPQTQLAKEPYPTSPEPYESPLSADEFTKQWQEKWQDNVQKREEVYDKIRDHLNKYEQAKKEGSLDQFRQEHGGKTIELQKQADALEVEKEKLRQEYGREKLKFRTGTIPFFGEGPDKDLPVGKSVQIPPFSNPLDQIVGQYGIERPEGVDAIEKEFERIEKKARWVDKQVADLNTEYRERQQSITIKHGTSQKGLEMRRDLTSEYQQALENFEQERDELDAKFDALKKHKMELYSNAIRQKYPDATMPDAELTGRFVQRPYYPNIQGGIPLPPQKVSI